MTRRETTNTPSFLRQGLFILQNDNSLANKKSAILAILVLGIWLAAVVFTESRHEFWRDEVRPLSLARAADSPLDLYTSVQYDGHPLVWYILLYAGKGILNSPSLLPVLSVTVGFAAVAIFLFLAPLPFWMKGLFIFSSFPFYEYSVMARNYGISMLLLFLAAVLYRYREKFGLLLAFVLALLANTNVHSVIFVGLIASLWLWQTVAERKATAAPKRWLSFGLSMGVIFVGIVVCLMYTLPKENTILTPIRQSLNLPGFLNALLDSVIHPEQTFDRIMPSWTPPLITAGIFFLAILGLLRYPGLLLMAAVGEIALGIFFRLVFPGFYQHQGLYIMFLVFLYWLYLDFQKNNTVSSSKSLVFRFGLYVAVLALLGGCIAKLRDTAWLDIHIEMSSSKSFGEFLKGHSVYQNAILLPEPDYLIESLPYYADNDIYLARERRFGNTVSWTTQSAPQLSLGELLSTALDLQDRYHRPVLIVLGHLNADFSTPGKIEYSYNKIFTWGMEDAKQFLESTELIADFNGAYTDENYKIYSLKSVTAELESEREGTSLPIRKGYPLCQRRWLDGPTDFLNLPCRPDVRIRKTGQHEQSKLPLGTFLVSGTEITGMQRRRIPANYW
jgi:hypothetical protein